MVAALIAAPDTSQWSANSVLDPNTGETLEYRQLTIRGPDRDKWLQSTANELGRLAQGVLPHMTTGTDTCFFIKHTDVPREIR